MEQKDKEYAIHLCQLHLDNDRDLYEREQAIFKVYFRTGERGRFGQTLENFARDIVSATNLREKAQPMIMYDVREACEKSLVEYMKEEYNEFVDYQDNAYDVKHDGKRLFTGTADACFKFLLSYQGQSTDFAIKHNGYSITPREMVNA